MGKKSKKIQTSYTTGGHNISETAIPLYQSNLTRMNDYLSDKGIGTTKEMYDLLYGNSTEWNDALRNYSRAMGQATANNYSATSGGYSSSGQRAYEDKQRYWNDQMSRLYDKGIQTSLSAANQYYNNLLSANDVYKQAYSLGKDYSDIEQYNNAVSQYNKNWWSPVASVAGGVLSAIPTGVTQALGAGLSALGSTTATDISDVTGNASDTGAANAGLYTNLGTGIGGAATSLYNKFQGRSNSSSTPSTSGVNSLFRLPTNTSGIENARFSWQEQ